VSSGSSLPAQFSPFNCISYQKAVRSYQTAAAEIREQDEDGVEGFGEEEDTCVPPVIKRTTDAERAEAEAAAASQALRQPCIETSAQRQRQAVAGGDRVF